MSGPEQRVFQFPDIAGPGVLLQELERVRRQAQVCKSQLIEEMLDQSGKIFLACAKGRKVDGKGTQAVIQIRAKPLLLDCGAEVFIGRRQHADVDRDGLFPANPNQPSFLQHPE